jgi:HSP20 family protein
MLLKLKNLKINTMTLLKVYNKNGYCRQNEAPALGFSDLLNEFPFKDFYSQTSEYGTPRVNIKEETMSYKIEMETPGIDKSLLKMDLSKDLLTISYKTEVTSSDEKFTHREFDLRNFERSFRLPESVDKDKISAKFHEGILLVDLPKREESIEKGPRNIEIS